MIYSVLKIVFLWFIIKFDVLCSNLAETLDVLETWVREFFNGLNSGSRRTRKFNSIGHIWNPDILYGLQAIGENHRFEISCMIPPKCDKFCLEKPENYLIQLLGDGKFLIFCALCFADSFRSYNYLMFYF